MTFDPMRICAVLNEEGVEYVVLGGFAAVIHGSPLPTEDIDVLPSRDRPNLERLARALRRIDAQLRTEAGPVPAPLDAAFIANMPHMLNLVTKHGDLDLTFAPAGPLGGYEEWAAHARPADLGDGLIVAVAALDDIIASKVAADRPKDQRAVPYLESLRDELRRQHRSGGTSGGDAG